MFDGHGLHDQDRFEQIDIAKRSNNKSIVDKSLLNKRKPYPSIKD